MSTAGWSTDVRVMLRPVAEYAWLATQPSGTGAWTLLRRPLFVAVVLGCSMSLLTRGYLSPGLIASGAVAWCFVPLAEVAGMAVALRAAGCSMGWSRAVDRFFTGHAPWLLWMVASAGFWILASDLQSVWAFQIWVGSFLLIAFWSAYIDLQFFRHIVGIAKPGRYLFLQRCISWALCLTIFGGGPLWPGILEELGFR